MVNPLSKAQDSCKKTTKIHTLGLSLPKQWIKTNTNEITKLNLTLPQCRMYEKFFTFRCQCSLSILIPVQLCFLVTNCCESNLSRRGSWADDSCVFWPFLNRHKKNYFIHFWQSGKNIMSLLKRNIKILPSLSTDWHPYFFS